MKSAQQLYSNPVKDALCFADCSHSGAVLCGIAYFQASEQHGTTNSLKMCGKLKFVLYLQNL